MYVNKCLINISNSQMQKSIKMDSLQILDPILMFCEPGQSRTLFSLPVHEGLWYNMYLEWLRPQDKKLKLPVLNPSCRQVTSTSAWVQLKHLLLLSVEVVVHVIYSAVML